MMPIIFLSFVFLLGAWGSDLERLPKVTDALYIKECGSCHIAYQPQLLPKESWMRMMEGLDRHFGSDASLEPEVAQSLRSFLLRHAGTSRKLDNAMAISEQQWFIKEHRKVPKEAFMQESVKSITNCAACHPRAEDGDYDSIRVPNYPNLKD